MFYKKIKKMVALVVVTVMAGSLVVGCGSKPATSADNAENKVDSAEKAENKDDDVTEGYTGKLVIAVHDQLNHPEIKEGIEYLKTTQKWKNVEFDVRPQDADYETNLPIEVMGGSQVDVVYAFNPIYLDSWANAGTIIPIDDSLEELGIDFNERYGSYANGASINGVAYGIPSGVSGWCIYYNKSIFDEAGIDYPDQYEPMTWSEYRQLAADLTSGTGADKVYGTLNLDWSMYWYHEATMSLGGGESFYTTDGLSNIENPAFADALLDTYNMQNIDKSTPTFSEIKTSQIEPDAWLTGNYAMYLHGNWMLNWLADTETYPRDFEVGFAPMPVPDDSPEGTLMTSGVVGAHSVAATTANATMATDFCVDLNEYATKYSSASVYCDQTVTSESLFVDICDKIEDPMFTPENVKFILLNPDMTLMSEKITGPKCSEYEAIVMEEVEMYLADAQDLDTTISNIKTRSDEVLKVE